jgi:hypothetical protein
MKEEVEQVSRQLQAKGMPEYLAAIQAAIQVSARRKTQTVDRSAAMASHCNEP